MSKLTKQELHCITNHMKFMHKQCILHETANLAEPCIECRFGEKCHNDRKYIFLDITQKLSRQTNIEFTAAIGTKYLVQKGK